MSHVQPRHGRTRHPAPRTDLAAAPALAALGIPRRINDDGFRGDDLPPASPNEVLVVGDSQVFGLGVEEDQTILGLVVLLLTGVLLVATGGLSYVAPFVYSTF